MPTCKVCSHPKLREIEALLINGEPNLRIASKFRDLSEKNIRDHRKTHFAERLSNAMRKLEERNELSLRAELVAIYAAVRQVVDAAKDVLIDKKTGKMNLRKRNAMSAANLLLKASDKVNNHLRMVGDLTGEFKQTQPNPRIATARKYEEFIQGFLNLYQSVDPKLTRRDVVLALKEMPEVTAEFMPMVLEELSHEETTWRR